MPRLRTVSTARAEPTAAPERATAQPRTARYAIRFLIGGHQWALVRSTVATFVGGLAEALSLILITRAGFAVSEGNDRVAVVGGWSLSVVGASLLVASLVLARIALGGFAAWQSAEVCGGAVADLRRRLSNAFLFASWEAQRAQRAGSLQALLLTHSGSANAMLVRFNAFLVAVTSLVALLGMAIAVDPAGALVLVLCVGVLGVLLLPFRSAVRGRARAQTTATMNLATSVDEVSGLGLELQVFGVQGAAEARLGAAIELSRRAATRLQFSTNISTPVYTGLAYLAIVGALAALAASNTGNVASLGAAMLLMLRSLSYGQAAQSAYIAALGQVPAIADLDDEIRGLQAARRVDGAVSVGSVGPITMDRVSFAYSGGKNVLRDLSFTIEPGEFIGVVGPSGSGKSTWAQLLLGLREPTEGSALASGRALSTLDRTEWARRVAFVPQGSHMIDASISENIRFLREGVTQEGVERAARLAHVHDDIVRMPGGYDYHVTPGNLSGGQQQRLCLARALVGAPDVLILDEPTSALDVRSEHLVRTTLAGLKGHMTVIVIAHRLSTVAICDRIMVINNGEMVAFDTPARLEESNDFYREALALSDGKRSADPGEPAPGSALGHSGPAPRGCVDSLAR